jgi:hypothetical protein
VYRNCEALASGIAREIRTHHRQPRNADIAISHVGYVPSNDVRVMRGTQVRALAGATLRHAARATRVVDGRPFVL